MCTEVVFVWAMCTNIVPVFMSVKCVASCSVVYNAARFVYRRALRITNIEVVSLYILRKVCKSARPGTCDI